MDKKKWHPEVSVSQARARQRASGRVSVYLPQPHPPTDHPRSHRPPDWSADDCSLLDYESKIIGYQNLQPPGSHVLSHT